MTKVEIEGGKYTICHENGAGLHALRHGDKWRDLCGDGMVLAMAQEIEDLRAELAAIKAQEPIYWVTMIGNKADCSTEKRIAERYAVANFGSTPFPVYAAPVSEARAQGVVIPAELDRAFITGESCDGVYRVAIQSETLKEMQAVHNWLVRLNSAPAAPAADAGVNDHE